MIKIGTKKVNKIVINNKEVLKVIQGDGTSAGILKYQAGSAPTVFTVNFTQQFNIGNTSTYAGALWTNSNTWIHLSNTISYTHVIQDINRQVSGEPDRPYSTDLGYSKFIQVNQLAFRNTTSTSRSNLYVRIYDYSLGPTNGLIYDSGDAGDGTFNLPANTTTIVYLTLSTKPQLDVSKSYAIDVYSYNWGSTFYREVKVILNNYDIAPGDAS